MRHARSLTWEWAVTSTVLLTGASRGIGNVAAKALLSADRTRHVVTPVRDPASTELPADGRVHAVPCDLADLDRVRTFADEVRRRLGAGDLPPLTAIGCNAGALLSSADQRTADGFESTFGVNVLAHHLLLRLLADRLAPPARIVLVSSGTHWGDLRHTGLTMPKPQWRPADELATPGTAPRASSAYAGRVAYTTSKLALVYLAHEWARRAPEGVELFAYDPGLVTGTHFGRHYGRAADHFYRTLARPTALLPLAATPRAAGRRLAHALVGEVPAGSGEYLELGRVVRSSPESYDEKRERELWEAADRLLGFA